MRSEPKYVKVIPGEHHQTNLRSAYAYLHKMIVKKLSENNSEKLAKKEA